MNISDYVKSFSKIANQTPSILSIVDLKGCIKFMNSEAASYVGIKPTNEVIDLPYENFNCKAAEDAKDFLNQDKLVIINRNEFKFLSYHNYIDGWKVILCKKSLLLDNNKNLIGLVSAVTDLTNYNLIDISRILFSKINTKKIKKSFSFQISSQNVNYFNLSERQLECLFFLIRGKSDREIAEILKLSPRTVETHIVEIKNKMGCSKRSHIIEKAFYEGYVNILPNRIVDLFMNKKYTSTL